MVKLAVRLATGLTGMLIVVAVAAAPDKAGQVTAAVGDVSAYGADAAPRRLDHGAPIYAGDRVITRRDGRVELRFIDNARFVLGPESELTVSKYRYKTGGDDSMVINMARGVFRFFSGLIAKNRVQSVQLVMPVATIGIRGTHVLAEVKATSATVALAQPEETGHKTAIEVSNAYGSVVIDQPGYETSIPDTHSPPSPPRRVQTQRIDNLLRSIQTIRRINAPRQPPRLPN